MTKILEVKGLEISFDTYTGKVRAIRGVNSYLNKGETLTIIGESGNGKSVTARSIMRLLSSNANIDAGQILFKGSDIVGKSERGMQKTRGRKIAMIFQDPMTSLDPTIPIGKQVAESPRKHNKASKKEEQEATLELLKLAKIPEAKEHINSYPHQFSGSQRQRVMIAIALVCYPEILVADESTTASDVTIQAQILELLKGAQTEIDTSVIFITHDLGVVTNVADRIAVMYGGRIAEVGTSEEILYDPQHPYAWGLLDSAPTLDGASDRSYAIPGSPPGLLNPPKRNAFCPRDEFTMKVGAEQESPFFKLSETHKTATWLLTPQAPKVIPPEGVQRHWAVFKEKQKHAYGQGGIAGAK